VRVGHSDKGRRMSRACACMMIAAAALALSACSTTLQVYSPPERETLRLRQGDLRDGGLAFLTPSTVTGQEEDKQSLAHVFAATLQSERPELRFVSLSGTWEGIDEVTFAIDTGQERPITFRAIAEHAAKDLIQKTALITFSRAVFFRAARRASDVSPSCRSAVL
jgi:hypothetical protein